MTLARLIAILLMMLCILAGDVYSCGTDIIFRSYLDRRFWQPYARYENTVLPVSKKNGAGKRNAEPEKFYFAGTSEEETTSSGLMQIRDAYLSESYDRARKELIKINKAELNAAEREELILIDAKLDMRTAEKEEPLNKPLLKAAQKKLFLFIKNSKNAAWQSEARGWIAHIYFLLGEYPDAVKIYLDELGMKDTIFDKESICLSLHMIFPYNGSDRGLANHLEEYFDTPEHALFVVYLVTNPVRNSLKDRSAMAGIAQKTINILQKRSDLFNKNKMSDVLALALMRAALYMGDTQAALNFSKKIPVTSRITRSSEYNWMIGICRFLRHEYAAAEEPLLKVLKANDITQNEYCAAAQGLIGVYQKLDRRVDQLRAALFLNQENRKFISGPVNFNLYISMADASGLFFDLPYLLDIQLTEDELREYLVRYEKESKGIVVNSYPRKRTAYEAVKYALAVRYARREKYRDAADIYSGINARPRAARMKELAGIYDNMEGKKPGTQERWAAEYKYASFLEEHSTQILFNDMFWYGFQTSAFLNERVSFNTERSGFAGLTKKERDFFLKKERELRDEQEERWRAYHILEKIVDEAGYSEIGEKAALKAIRCLDMISVERFGREKEIDAERKKLIKWFRLAKKTA